MSFEFFASLPQTVPLDLVRLANSLCRQMPVELIATELEHVSLRWKASSNELEEIGLWHQSDTVTLAIHVGTGAQQDQLLECVTREILQMTGVAVSFAEE